MLYAPWPGRRTHLLDLGTAAAFNVATSAATATAAAAPAAAATAAAVATASPSSAPLSVPLPSAHPRAVFRIATTSGTGCRRACRQRKESRDASGATSTTSPSSRAPTTEHCLTSPADNSFSKPSSTQPSTRCSLEIAEVDGSGTSMTRCCAKSESARHELADSCDAIATGFTVTTGGA
eukprot:4408381-Pleurochrysis_carterae.AAC.1